MVFYIYMTRLFATINNKYILFVFFLFFSLFSAKHASAVTVNSGFVSGIWYSQTPFFAEDDIRIYTTSTNPLVRYFLFMFTCFIYNVWKFFQSFIGEDFTLANFCTNMNKFMIERELIQPRQYKDFLLVFTKYNSLSKLIR